MSEFKKYPSIGKIKDVFNSVKKMNPREFSHLDIAEDGTKTPVFTEGDLPKLNFRGTVKLHGTNACVVINSDLTTDAQSRTRILSLTSDNHGFCNWATTKSEVFVDAYKHLLEDPNNYSLHVFGEWCGANIQSGVALTGIGKTFVIFGILLTTVDDEEVWLPSTDVVAFADKENDIRNIYEFKTYEVEIDMNNPEAGLKIIDELRDSIDLDCPVAKALGSTAEQTFGEGNVWRCTTEGYTGLSFKHKGENHCRKGSKPKKQKIEEPLTEEQQSAFDNFLKEAVTVDRLAQGIEFLQEQDLELSQRNTGVYLKWFSSDVQKECKIELEVLLKTGLVWNQVAKPLSQMAREFLFSEIDKI